MTSSRISFHRLLAWIFAVFAVLFILDAINAYWKPRPGMYSIPAILAVAATVLFWTDRKPPA
jgi:hypothetical protein